jgi:hypothetical protein
MALRPIAFSIPSTTQLKVTFSDNLSDRLSADNFEVQSLNGAVDDLEVLGLEIDGKVALVKTRPQVSSNYYLLKFLDTAEVIFTNERGGRLIDDAVSRELFFVGIEDVNPVRDRMLRLVPNLFDVENTVLKTVMSAQADEFFRAQKAIGQVLADNYICETVVDEPRTRTAGAFDRMANENAFNIIRVSDRQTGDSPTADILDYTGSNPHIKLRNLPIFPVSLQQSIVEDETININSEGNSFDGYLISVKNRNIIRLLSVTLIRNGEVEDCDGNIGTLYDIDRFKYTLKDNFYDQESAFSFQNLKDNQILLSEFGNIPRPTILDTVIVTYLYKDKSRLILEDTVEVSRVESQANEAVPTNSTRFFLDNAPIVNANNEVVSKGGVRFKITENSTESPPEFKHEIIFNFSKLPSRPGEYSINYETGEVFVFGIDSEVLGTGRNTYVADYLYRREFIRDIDYSISDNDLVATPDRSLSDKEAEIFIQYDRVFVSGSDYRASSHVEVMPEFVENRINQSFSIKTKNAPITDVFRILNQTTGEVYTPTFFSDTEIFFAGNRSPKIKTVESENPKFGKVASEDLSVVGEFIVPAFSARITSNISNNSIMFEPGIPAELISQNSQDYFIRELESTADEEVNVSDVQIRFFGDPDAENLITSCGISATATPPSINSNVIIGTRAYVINLDNIRIMNLNEDTLGSLVNSSITFSNKTIFAEEKFFEPLQVNPGFSSTTDGGLMLAFTEEKGSVFGDNLSRLRNVGDYAVDYRNGIIYSAVSFNQDIFLDNVSYSFGKHFARNRNVLDATSATKKIRSADSLADASIIYNSIANDVTTISVLDIENSLTIFDEETTALDLDDNRSFVAEVRDDYTVLVPHNILNINSIFRYTDLVGKSLNSSVESDRQEEFGAEELKLAVRDGGRNLFDPSCVSFVKNVIDLKKVVSKRVTENTDGDFILNILDDRAETFINAVRVSTGQVFFDEELNITKLGGLSVVSSTISVMDPGSAIVEIDAIVSILSVDTDGDFLLDVNGDRFEITDVDAFTSKITVVSPAINNILADKPALDSSANTEVIVKPAVDITAEGISILIPGDSGLSDGELLDITYLTDLIPDVGTPLVIDYRYGNIFLDYTYLADELVVWYEYGDNALDWSISSTLLEGEEYFVTYQYGALRTALRRNFGTLTSIPFFLNFSLGIDRELYRDAIKGVLQTFPKGPTIPAYEELVKSFTDIVPNIEELVFGNWILGRDFTCPGKVDYRGVLDFKGGRFDTGLKYNDDVVTNIPAISSVDLDEGTLEAWIRPDWCGIANDAELTFFINHIGPEEFQINKVRSPFSAKDDWTLAPFDESVGGTDFLGIGTRIFNYRTDDSLASEFQQGNFALYKNIEKLSPITDLELLTQLKVNSFGLVLDTFSDIDPTDITSPQEFYSLGEVSVFDGQRQAGAEMLLARLGDFSEAGLIITGEELTPENLEEFGEVSIEIDLGGSFDLFSALDSYNVSDDTPDSFVILDSEGIFYQVLAFENELGETFNDTIPDFVRKIFVDRFGINNPSLSQSGISNINSTEPVGDLKLYSKVVGIISSPAPSKSELALGLNKLSVINWSLPVDIAIQRTPRENIVLVTINGEEQAIFYTELPEMDSATIDEPTATSLKGVVLGITSSEILSSMETVFLRGVFYNYFNLEDIYIGKEAFNPRRIPFTVQRNDLPHSPVGVPFNIEVDEGIFIGYDELCKSPLTDEVGQWVFRTRANRRIFVPIDVFVSGPGVWDNIFGPAEINHCFAGEIFTDGEFSSVSRSFRDEFSDGCERLILIL